MKCVNIYKKKTYLGEVLLYVVTLQVLILNYFVLWQISQYKPVYFNLNNFLFILLINQIPLYGLVKNCLWYLRKLLIFIKKGLYI